MIPENRRAWQRSLDDHTLYSMVVDYQEGSMDESDYDAWEEYLHRVSIGRMKPRSVTAKCEIHRVREAGRKKINCQECYELSIMLKDKRDGWAKMRRNRAA